MNFRNKIKVPFGKNPNGVEIKRDRRKRDLLDYVTHPTIC